MVGKERDSLSQPAAPTYFVITQTCVVKTLFSTLFSLRGFPIQVLTPIGSSSHKKDQGDDSLSCAFRIDERVGNNRDTVLRYLICYASFIIYSSRCISRSGLANENALVSTGPSFTCKLFSGKKAK